jgi:hypothetical protein
VAKGEEEGGEDVRTFGIFDIEYIRREQYGPQEDYEKAVRRLCDGGWSIVAELNGVTMLKRLTPVIQELTDNARTH